jgi:hypothetical protein
VGEEIPHCLATLKVEFYDRYLWHTSARLDRRSCLAARAARRSVPTPARLVPILRRRMEGRTAGEPPISQ